MSQRSKHTRINEIVVFVGLLSIAANIVQLVLQRRERTFANLDHRSGLSTYDAWKRDVAREILRLQRYGRAGSLLLLDIDNFKQINDVAGHQQGDGVISQIGSILRRSTRAYDLTARYGGDEFLIFLPESTEEVCRGVADRIHSLIAERKWIIHTNAGFLDQRVTISVGYALFPTHGINVTELVQAADRGLYTAKRRGRGQTGRATPH